jgi:plastocyanin
MKDNSFEPKDFTLPAGSRITIKNEGAAMHNLTVEGQDFNKDVNPGETENEDLELPAGTYTIFCRFHRSQGMEGTLAIEG